MANPIGDTGSTAAPSSHSVTTTAATDSAGSVNPVSSGFSTANSVSQTSGSSPVTGQDSVALDAPAVNEKAGGDFLAQTIQSRIDSFRAIVAYNNALVADGLDVSDTQNLLLSFRGIINDLRLLNNAMTIDIRASQRQEQLSLTSDISRLSIEHEESQSRLNLFRSIVKSNPDDQGLKDELAEMEVENLTRELRLSAKETRLSFNNLNDNIVRALSVAPVNSASKSSLESGEERLDELKRELQVLDKRFDSDEVRSRLASLFVAEFDRDTLRKIDRHSDTIRPRGLTTEFQALLDPQIVSNLFKLFSAQNSSALDLMSNQTAPSQEQLVDAAEGLALTLLAEPSVMGSEENPVDQPYLGDSLSLEGANNPQAFVLLLLKERMADLREALEKNSEGLVIDSAGAGQLGQLLEAERAVDAMVVETIQDQELAEANIRKASRA